jgi:hypothetical protein
MLTIGPAIAMDVSNANTAKTKKIIKNDFFILSSYPPFFIHEFNL